MVSFTSRSAAWQWALRRLGALIPNAFLCSIEEKLDQDNKIPEFYRRYVDNTFATMKNVPTPEDFLSVLDSCHPPINFTVELPSILRYPDSLINSTISHFITLEKSKNPRVQAQLSTNKSAVHRVVLPFKDQKSADADRTQL